MVQDEELLLALLNSAPIENGQRRDRLSDGNLLARFGGTGTRSEREQLQRMRDSLQQVVRGDERALGHIAHLIQGAALVPEVTRSGMRWELQAAAESRIAARAAIAWSELEARYPARLRPCANAECNLFLVDHSKPGTAKWCSMATCGNRMKARAYSARSK